MVGTGKGAESGILIRSAEALETAHKLELIVLDKTGTITQGKPALTDVIPSGELDEGGLLLLAASAESRSEHPLGEAVVRGAAERGLELSEPAEFESVTGRGLRATVDGSEVLIGSRALLAGARVATDALEDEAERLEGEGRTAMFIAVDGEPAGLVAVADTVKPGAAEAIAALRERRIEVVMITGDNV
jgi:Cu+-exporting ATPase